MPLPSPSDDALEHSLRLSEHLRQRIRDAGGWLSFAAFMEALLYAPGLGYYTAGAHKLGAAGDFVTAPELSPLFARSLTAPLRALMDASAPVLLEVGAGSGQLACDLLQALEAEQALPEQYAILELSPDLRQRQQATLADSVPHLLSRIVWLDHMPERFKGAVVANEVLDAMPAHLVCWQANGPQERGVALDGEGQFIHADQATQGALRQAAEEIAAQCPVAPGYLSEISLANRAWAAEWGHRLEQGGLLLIDYGFPRREFYHPQRTHGTLMCHYRHHAHPDPFYLPGLQDVTVHVDFTAIIAAAHPAGLDLLGYTTQGQFLLNTDILGHLARIPNDSPDYIRASRAVNTLVMPHEMGELFKVIALGKGVAGPLPGFQQGDQAHRL